MIATGPHSRLEKKHLWRVNETATRGTWPPGGHIANDPGGQIGANHRQFG